ncbi:MAG: glycosyltransferase family 4 protein [Candidatus Aegiribacteria sp.]|nr:glycosyltransferase family 4 protein [Candidatus Aegiribacteria sp.]
MRIGFDASGISSYCGIHTYSRELIRHLLQEFPEDRFVLLSTYSKSRKRKLRQEFGIHQNLEIRSVLPNRLALGSSFIKLILFLRSMIIRHQANSFDILHITKPFAERTGARNSVITVQDLFPLTLDDYQGEDAKKEFDSNVAFILEESKAIIVPTEYTANQLCGLYPEVRGKVNVVPLAAGSGFRQERNSPPESLRKVLPEGISYFLYVGSAYPRKNLDRVLEAYLALPETQKKKHFLVLLLTGVASHLSDFKERNRNTLSEPNIIVLDSVSEEELVRLYSSAVAFLFPSLDEGFGLPIIEAMRCGCPVITSNVSCMPEVAGDAAILVDPFSVKSIARGLEQAAFDMELRTRMIEKGRERRKLFTWQNSADQLWEVIEKVLNDKK